MKNRIVKKFTIFVICFLSLAPSIQATTIISNEELAKPIKELNNIRKQFMYLSESGYFNHVQEKSNTDAIKLTNLYIDQIPDIRQSLENYKSEDLDKFSTIKINSLLGGTLFLKNMGDNLIDYLSSTNLKDQYDFYTIHLKYNDFIIEILSDVENSEY